MDLKNLNKSTAIPFAAAQLEAYRTGWQYVTTLTTIDGEPRGFAMLLETEVSDPPALWCESWRIDDEADPLDGEVDITCALEEMTGRFPEILLQDWIEEAA